MDVQARGLEEVRKVPGFHDEPLSGQRQHQRSIRLNLHWRAVYEVHGDEVKVALVVEVIPHSY
jgi:toxin HigB-1